MRIIAGSLKSRVVKAVPGKETRPTSDKVKEAIYHKLGPYFEGGHCLDLFAGSGSLGIEAISRGMDDVIFVERANKAVQVIHHNIKQLDIASQSKVMRMDVYRALPILGKKVQKFDLILFDPPYEKISYESILESIQKHDLLTNNGKVYIEASTHQAIVYDSTYYDIVYEKKYSSTTSVTILEKAYLLHT